MSEISRRDFLKGITGLGITSLFLNKFPENVRADNVKENVSNPILLNTEINENFLNGIGHTTIDDIESGAHTELEQELLRKGEIPPFDLFSKPSTMGNFVQLSYDNKINMVDIEMDSRMDERLPYEISDFSLADVDGQKILVIGLKVINLVASNVDDNVSFLHLGVQTFKDETTAFTIRKIIAGEYRVLLISSIKEEIPTDPHIDYSQETVMQQRYLSQKDSLEPLFREWADTDVVPNELQNKLLMMKVAPLTKNIAS